MTMEAALDIAIKEVCPIHGISFGDYKDKNTWRIDFKDEATSHQKALAQKVLVNFIWDDAYKEKHRKYIRNLDNENNLVLRKGYKDYLVQHPVASFSDYLDYLESN